MNKFALVILTKDIKVKKFEHKDDFDTARQTLITKEVHYVPLKWHAGVGIWVKPETYK